MTLSFFNFKIVKGDKKLVCEHHSIHTSDGKDAFDKAFDIEDYLSLLKIL